MAAPAGSKISALRFVPTLGTVSLLADFVVEGALSALLTGLLLNTLLRWAWTDFFGALVIAGFATKEGIEAWKGDTCAAPVTTPHRRKGSRAQWLLLTRSNHETPARASDLKLHFRDSP